MFAGHLAARQISTASSSSLGSDSLSSEFDSSVCATPPTPFTDYSFTGGGSADPTYLKVQGVGLPVSLSPVSLEQYERNGPQLPQYLPQLPNNATPTKVAEQVALEASFHSTPLS